MSTTWGVFRVRIPSSCEVESSAESVGCEVMGMGTDLV
jgi:hypothetical protein